MKDPKEIEKEKSKKYNNKEIIALSDFEHCLTRPTMYVGSVEKSDERVQIIEGGKIVEKTKTISVGFYKMLNEIVDNAFDEAKRMAGKMPTIIVKINSKTNEVTVIDTGDGFINAEKINQKTGSSNVETAMTMLRAGSNFYNDSASDALIGTNGVGAALVNMLSDSFEITTTNSEVTYQIGWDRFVKKQEECASRKNNPLGTNVKYIPRKDIFKSCKWDKEYLHSMFIFRQYLKNRDSIISNLSLEFYFDDEKLNLDIDFLPENAILLTTKLGIFAAWINFESSASVSFINGANCVGIHQKIVTDWMNDIFNYPQAYRFFETLLILNLPPKLVRFADQNKTRYAANRNDIQELLEKNFYKSLRQQLPKSEFFHLVKKAIEEHTKSAELKNIKSKKKAATKKISDKYFPPSQSKGTLFIVEGSSAMGSILQKRDPRMDAVYSLKGKIKNARVLSDLASNAEIIDLMNILNLEPGDGSKCSFANVVIATDWDPDGIGHIASLIINLFYKWFPQVIDAGKLNILITPLVSAEVKNKRKYFYSMSEWNEFESSKESYNGVRYLKGLGSLSIQDWQMVMAERKMYRIKNDSSANRYIDIAFGNSSDKRKRWLEGRN
jgi:DNA gyrase/topoisomerase IV subunit B